MKVSYKHPFFQFVKKSHRPLRLAIEDEIQNICAKPSVGEMKVADLAGIQVYKFHFNHSQYLIAYRVLPESGSLEFLHIDFLQVGPHENFYRRLKQYLRHLMS